MGYVAVQGGQEAIEQSNRLWQLQRVKGQELLTIQTILSTMKPLVDQVMSEASLYDEELAALAIKQAGASMEEAVFLLRAHRSTIPRKYYSTITDSKKMFVERRISASFKDIPGGQLLGSANDFNQRFLNFDLINETAEDVTDSANILATDLGEAVTPINLSQLPKVREYLEELGLMEIVAENNADPDDITKKSIQFPSSRSQKLQSLTRGQTGAVTSLGYAEIRSFGVVNHPNIGELRVGQLPITVAIDPESTGEEDDYYIGSVEVTEVESFYQVETKDADGQDQTSIGVGYGMVYGQNETKAIAMSILDYSLNHKDPSNPTANDEFILLHIDSVESTGFISHLKLPHYVTFQSKLDGMRGIREAKGGKHEL